MIVLVAPEPAAWIAPVAAAALRAGPVVIFAPWALPPALTALSSAAPLRRRALTVAPLRTLPGWIAVEALARLWSRSRTDRQMRARFALRGAVDALAARWLPRGCEVVIAPALAARRTFAEAIVRGAATVLVEDLPSLRALHADLDAAAARHPAARFLGHFRASPAVVAAQEAERVLARCVLVRSHHARSQHGGRPPGAMLDLPTALIATTAAQGTQAGSTRRVLLAGLAAARHGTFEALDAIQGRPIELVVRAGEGTEPADLLHRPQVRASTRDERERLAGIDLVLAPSWCESHAPEVALAAAMGVPVVATRRGAGLVDLALAGAEVSPGDALGLAAAIDRALALGPRPTQASVAGEALTAWLDGLLRPTAGTPKRPVRLRIVS